MEPTKPSHGKDNSEFMKMGEQVEPGEINKLPPEIINLIIAENTGTWDLKSSSEVNKTWNKESIIIAKNELAKLSGIVDIIIKNLPEEYADKKDALGKILEGKTLFQSVNINEIKASTIAIRRNLEIKIATILKDLKIDDQKKLNNLFEKDGEMTIILDLAKILTNSESTRIRIAASDLQMGNFDEAMKILDTIDDKTYFPDISMRLAQYGYLDKALEFYEKIPPSGMDGKLIIDLDEMDEAGVTLIKHLLQDGNINKAKEIANNLGEGYLLDYALQMIQAKIDNKT